MINRFLDKYFFLSNFYPCHFEFEGIVYPNSEAAFQAQKAQNDLDKHSFKRLNGAEAKKLGREIKIRTDWENVKNDVMYRVVKAKFEQDDELRARLLETGNKELVEGNTWHDNYWGSCFCIDCKNEQKKNNLGITLMRVREEFRNKG